jgi:hypothetical protein
MMGNRTWSRLAAAGLVLVVGASVAACGVSESGSPTDIGDAVNVATNDRAGDKPVQPPLPESGDSAVGLVRDYLHTAAGGDDGTEARLRSFLTKDGAAGLKPLPNRQGHSTPLTLIRLVGDPSPKTDGLNQSSVVEVRYQSVGVLNSNDEGLVTDPSGDSSTVHAMTFTVVPGHPGLPPQIDKIEGDLPPTGPWLSDDALDPSAGLYRPQPIYFWDYANRWLIPDIRYVPLTAGPDQRAQMIVQWLVSNGPSPWLLGSQGAQRLPAGAAVKEGVTNQGGAWVVNLAGPSAGTSPGAAKRLYLQLVASLSLFGIRASVKLLIEGQPQPDANDALSTFSLSRQLDEVRQASYDITVDGKVGLSQGTPATQATSILNAVATKPGVVYAAIDRTGATMAVVRTDPGGKRYLQLATGSDAATVPTALAGNVGRPFFIPGTTQVIVPANGQMYVVAQTGVATDITPVRKGGVRSLSVSPDGRRIAWVADDGAAFVAPLMVGDNQTVTVGATPRPVLANQLKATGIAWTGEGWLFVVGTDAAGAPAIYRTTVDSACAKQVPANNLTKPPTDVVALPDFSLSGANQAQLFAGDGRYTVSSAGGGSTPYRNAFFVA